MEDVKATLAIFRKDVAYKKEKVAEYQAKGETHRADLLKAEIKGIRDVLDDLDHVVY